MLKNLRSLVRTTWTPKLFCGRYAVMAVGVMSSRAVKGYLLHLSEHAQSTTRHCGTARYVYKLRTRGSDITQLSWPSLQILTAVVANLALRKAPTFRLPSDST